MNIFPISIGQGGNQLCNSFINNIEANIDNLPYNNIFKQQNSIELYNNRFYIDTETKVINSNFSNITTNNKDLNIIYNNYGRGSNWAMGYSLEYKEKEKSNINIDISDKLKKYIEKLDFIEGFHLFNSLTGGTGSGVTSRTIETLRDEYPKSVIINSCIIPFEIENNTLSLYNQLLYIAHNYDLIDYIVPLNNNTIIEYINSKDEKSKLNYNAINNLYCKNLVNCLYSEKYKKTSIFKDYIEDCTFSKYSIFNKIKFIDLFELKYNSVNDIETTISSTIKKIIKLFNINLNSIYCLNLYNKSNLSINNDKIFENIKTIKSIDNKKLYKFDTSYSNIQNKSKDFKNNYNYNYSYLSIKSNNYENLLKNLISKVLIKLNSK